MSPLNGSARTVDQAITVQQVVLPAPLAPTSAQLTFFGGEMAPVSCTRAAGVNPRTSRIPRSCLPPSTSWPARISLCFDHSLIVRISVGFLICSP
jgi:hypothetical protein